jgi:hypothetical protein
VSSGAAKGSETSCAVVGVRRDHSRPFPIYRNTGPYQRIPFNCRCATIEEFLEVKYLCMGGIDR